MLKQILTLVRPALCQTSDLLERLEDFLVSIHNACFRIDVLALHALLRDARGEESAAREKLTESLALAEHGGFIRNFVDLGPPMTDLLQRLIKQNVAVDYIQKILAAFQDDEETLAQIASPPPPSPILRVPLSPPLPSSSP